MFKLVFFKESDEFATKKNIIDLEKKIDSDISILCKRTNMIRYLLYALVLLIMATGHFDNEFLGRILRAI